MTVYGRNSVEEALEEGLELTEAVIEREKMEAFSRLSARLKEKGVPVRLADFRALEKISGSRKHQGICAVMKTPGNVFEDENRFDKWEDLRTVLALDGITDTGNLGAILRSALLFGCDAVVLPNDNSARVTPQTIRSSAGALYKIPLVYVNNLNTALEKLKAMDFMVYGLAGESKTPVSSINFGDRTCLVVGSEREGLRRSVKRSCDALVSIPTTRRLDSLNASVASAVALWECYRVHLQNTSSSTGE